MESRIPRETRRATKTVNTEITSYRGTRSAGTSTNPRETDLTAINSLLLYRYKILEN